MRDKAKIYIQAEDKTREAFTSVQRNLGQLQTAAAGAIRAFGGIGGIGAGLSLAGLVGFTKSAIDAADQLGKLSARTGVTVETLAGLKHAADLSDVSIETLAKGFRQLSVDLVAAQNGDEKLRGFFQTIGVQGTDATQALYKISDAIKSAKTPAEQLALANAALSKSGQEMLPALIEGGEALRKLVEEGKRLNPTTKEMADRAMQFNDNLERMKKEAGLAGINLAKVLLPSLEDTARAMVELQEKGHGALAVLRGFAGLGKLPLDILFPADDFSAAGQIKAREDQLKKLRQDLYAKSFGGAPASITDPIREQIKVLEAQLESFKKFKDQVRPQLPKIEPEQSDAAQAALCYKDGGVWDAKARTCIRATGSSKGAKAQGPIDVFGNGSFVTKNKETAEFIKNQFKDYNDLGGEAFKEATAAAEKQAEAVAQIRAEIVGIIDPVEKYRVKLAEVDAALAAGTITPEQAAEARFYWNEQIDGALGFNKAIQESNDFAKSFGLAFTSAMEDALVNGKKFSDVLKGIEQDLARIIIRKSITEPLGNAASKFLGSFDFGKLFSFADGGIMTSAGPVPLRAYAGGGVANSPQFALFGEGSQPEAFVPLPDGRSIPVKMQGGGTVLNYTQNISIDSRSDQASILAAMNQAKNRAKAEILDSLQRGGAFAKATRVI